MRLPTVRPVGNRLRSRARLGFAKRAGPGARRSAFRAPNLLALLPAPPAVPARRSCKDSAGRARRCGRQFLPFWQVLGFHAVQVLPFWQVLGGIGGRGSCHRGRFLAASWGTVAPSRLPRGRERLGAKSDGGVGRGERGAARTGRRLARPRRESACAMDGRSRLRRLRTWRGPRRDPRRRTLGAQQLGGEVPLAAVPPARGAVLRDGDAGRRTRSGGPAPLDAAPLPT